MIGWWLACATPEGVFERDVVPALERSCGSSQCHGVGPDSERRGEVLIDGAFLFRVDGRGRVSDPAEARRAALANITTVEDPDFSTLLRKPLDPAFGGLPHGGGIAFPSPAHEDYLTLRRWIALEPKGGEDEAPLDEREATFAEALQAPMLAMGCAGAACHGPSSGVPFRLDPGLAGQVPRAGTRRNVEATLTMVSVGPDPLQSRVLRKMLPLTDGGIAHKGGNRSFLGSSDDPRLAPMVRWVEEERARRVGDAQLEPSGVVFVRGPVGPEDPFDLDVFFPGTDLWLAPLDQGGVPHNLTADLHAEPADVRDPAVDDSGTRVAFTMRTSGREGHELWVLDLVTGGAERVLAADGANHRDPTWAPDGAVWFVSTRAGEVADDGHRLDGDLYRLDLQTGQVTRRTWTPHIERKPVFFVHGEEAGGELGFTALREAVRSQRRAHPFRFPPDLSTEYHQHFGITPPEDLFFDLRELPDGRYVTVVGDLTGVWGGRLGLVDRNFGPELVTAGEPSVPAYVPPLVRLDPASTSAGVSGSVYRDPSPLPDGSILAAWAPGPLDLADPEAPPPDWRIVRLRLRQSPEPALEVAEVLVDERGVADFDPEPVGPRQPSPVVDPGFVPHGTRGRVRHQGVASIDALLGHLEPGGAKGFTQDVVSLRIIESVPVGPEERAPVPPAETRWGFEGATTTSLSRFGPARVLGEVALEADGSSFLDLPAPTAVRFQLLDARGLRVGAHHNRWFDLAPGQVLNQGVPLDAYGTACAVCHGSLDGAPTAPRIEPDVMTSASFTLARYERQDPRLPREPTRLSDPVAADWSTVRPILDARCSACHARGGAPPDLSDEPTTWFDTAYEELLGGWVDPESARASPLLELLAGTELDAPGPAPSEPHGGLDEDELRAVARWIDVGATWSTP